MEASNSKQRPIWEAERRTIWERGSQAASPWVYEDLAFVVCFHTRRRRRGAWARAALLGEELQQELAMDGCCVHNLVAVVEGGAGVSDSRASNHRNSSWLGVCPAWSGAPPAVLLVPSESSGSNSKQAKSSELQADV